MNFENLAIDTSRPLKFAGRKGRRAGGLTKQERKRAMLIIGGVMGGCLLAIGLIVVIWAVFIAGRQAPKPVAAPETEATSAPTDEKSDAAPAEVVKEKPAKNGQEKAASKVKADSQPKAAANADKFNEEAIRGSRQGAGGEAAPKRLRRKRKQRAGPKTRPSRRQRKNSSRAANSTASPQDHGRVAFVVNALVTGAGGFLGLYLVEQLTARGERVRALCRRPSRQLDALGVEMVQADLRDREATVAACRGMDVVFHAAGVAGIGGPWQRYYQSNTLGRPARRRRLPPPRRRPAGLHQQSQRHLRRPRSKGRGRVGPLPSRWLCHYPHSKALAEQEVLAANGRARLLTCALRPHLIWGPRDRQPCPAIAGPGRGGQTAPRRRRHEPDRHGLRGKCRRGPSAGGRRPRPVPAWPAGPISSARASRSIAGSGSTRS